MAKIKKQGLNHSRRFAIVDESTPIRFLNREEFEALKRSHPNIMEMTAGDIVYLTKMP